MPEARSISDEMMDCVDRLGSEFDSVDPRVWGHLLVYAPDDKVLARARAALSQPAPSPQPAVPEWLNSAFPNSEDLHALGLTAPTPAQFAQQLYKRWKAKLEKVEEELCALKATNAPQPAPVDEREAEIAELRAEVLAWRNQCDRLTHQVICCGVAASHPDATLTTRGAYAGKWNSGQAEEVRKLRAERDALAALQSPAPQAGGWLPIESAPKDGTRLILW